MEEPDCIPAHSRRVLADMDVGCEDVMAGSIFTIPTCLSELPQMAFSGPKGTRYILRNPLHSSSPLFQQGPSILVTDCSFRAAKVGKKHLPAVLYPPA